MTKPAYAESDARGNRWYRIGEDRYPSVTTVIKVLAAPALESWKQRQVALAAVSTIDWREQDAETAVEMIMAASRGGARRRANLGTAVHSLIEDGEVDEAPEDLIPYLVAAGAVIANLGEHYASELTLVDPKHGYAGTADVLTHRLERPSELCVTDWKTTKLTGNVGWREHQLQLAALSQCTHYLDNLGILHELEHEITELMVVGLREDESTDVKSLDDPAKIATLHQAFLGCLDVFTLEQQYPNLTIWEDQP